jgi:hypothetical protein
LVDGEDPKDFMQYIEILSRNLKRVIFIRNPGKEIITEYT